MRVLYVSEQNLYRPNGARSHVLGLSKGINAIGHDVRIMSPLADHPVVPDELERARRTTGSAMLERVGRFLRLGRFAKRVEAMLGSGWPDVLLCRQRAIHPRLITALEDSSAPTALEINGFDEDERPVVVGRILRPWFRRIDTACLKAASLVIAVSPGIRDGLLSRYPFLRPDEILVLQNAVDTTIFGPLEKLACRAKLGLDPDIRILAFVGWVAPWHGVDLALNALRLIRQRGLSNVLLLVVGNGPSLTALRRSVDEAGLRDAVRFYGAVPRTEVPLYVGAADVCLAPFTNWRNNSTGVSALKLWEYIACARPTICTEVKGVREVIELAGVPELIRVCEADNPSALADAISASIEAPYLPDMSQWGDVLERISWESRARELTKTLLAIV